MDVETSPAFAGDASPFCRSRSRAIFDIGVAYFLILWVIWTPRPWQERVYFVAAAFVIVTASWSFPGLDTLGFRLANLSRSFWLVCLAGMVGAAEVLVAAHIHSLHSPSTAAGVVKRFAGYVIFSFVQQFLLQDYFLLRIRRLTDRAVLSALIAASIFSLAHLPNPILVVATFVWGTVACLHFLRYRNIYPLAIAHAILGIALAVSVPGPVIRNMRVGLGYVTYGSHHATQRSH